MVKIGLLSDTHAWWDDRYEKYLPNVTKSGTPEI